MFSGFITDILDAVSVPEGWRISSVAANEGEDFSFFSIEIRKDKLIERKIDLANKLGSATGWIA